MAVTPGPGEIAQQGALLSIGAPQGFDFAAVGLLETTVTLIDVSGADTDTVTIVVRLGSQAGVDLCGHASDSSVGGAITATDALIALRAVVGLHTCELCRCDVDSSGAVVATDALVILKAAVAQNVVLNCVACG